MRSTTQNGVKATNASFCPAGWAVTTNPEPGVAESAAGGRRKTDASSRAGASAQRSINYMISSLQLFKLKGVSHSRRKLPGVPGDGRQSLLARALVVLVVQEPYWDVSGVAVGLQGLD